MEQGDADETEGGGGVILLNGASSSGRSTRAALLQSALPDPFLYLSRDQLVDPGAIPVRRDVDGTSGWPGLMRSRFFAGFHRCIPAMAEAGNDLIVDHVIEHSPWRRELAKLLTGFDVLFVGGHCDVDELDRRERSRADRRAGEGRAHVESNRIHQFGRYDITVDTTAGVTAHEVNRLVAAWSADRSASVLTTFGIAR